ncbi:MAG: hypothetical protein HeimC3_08880 [Candidatus Heimdallarchaeota archaeon LC_3]|nr:MAG: hypothetical protein HeimC3_08880 [Candidatus Heimdallarchaeota archaeon LC_3]
MSEKEKKMDKKSLKEISIAEIFSLSKFTSIGVIFFFITLGIALLLNNPRYVDIAGPITYGLFAFSFQFTLLGLIIDILRWRDYSDWGALGAIIAYIGFSIFFFPLYFPFLNIDDLFYSFSVLGLGILLLIIGFTSRATEIDYKIELQLSNLWKAIRTYNYKAIIPYLLSLTRTLISGFVRYVMKGLLSLRMRIQMFLKLVYRGLSYTFIQTKNFFLQTFPLALKRSLINIWNNFHWIGLGSGILFVILSYSPQENLYGTVGIFIIIIFFFSFGVIYPQRERIINIVQQIQAYSWETSYQLNYRLRTIGEGRRKIKCTNCDKDIPLGSHICESCEKEVIRCMICKLPLKKGQKLSECPNCKNPAHENHWNFWINLKHDCPLCKKSVLA